jgi:iron complex transport system substrate-binding protein
MYPHRIACLTEETVETLYSIGAADRIAGISRFVVRPPGAKDAHARISNYIPRDPTDCSREVAEILAVKPDLVIAWSDLQAPISAALIKVGVPVVCFNQRTVAECLQTIRMTGALVGKQREAHEYADGIARGLDDVRIKGAALPRKPRVYFEEWFDPIITGIGWVSELIAIAGGEDCFAHLSGEVLAKNRILATDAPVIAAAPDVMVASWCGKKFMPDKVRARAGWDAIPAIRDGELHEIDSPVILQPGPAALTDGVAQLHAIFAAWARR